MKCQRSGMWNACNPHWLGLRKQVAQLKGIHRRCQQDSNVHQSPLRRYACYDSTPTKGPVPTLLIFPWWHDKGKNARTKRNTLIRTPIHKVPWCPLGRRTGPYTNGTIHKKKGPSLLPTSVEVQFTSSNWKRKLLPSPFFKNPSKICFQFCPTGGRSSYLRLCQLREVNRTNW